MVTHDYYNVSNFPRKVWSRPDANWDIYANAKGTCAAIATKPGAKCSGFGDLAHVARIKREDAARRGFKRNIWRKGFGA